MDDHEKQQFVDILKGRRINSDILWATRPWYGKRVYKPSNKNSPSDIKSIVLNSYRLKLVLQQISQEKNIPILLLYDVAKQILEEIGFNREVSILRWLALFVSKLLKKLCTAVYLNEAKLLKIRASLGQNPVLFVPSHKSYCDFILMSFICFTYEIDIPRIAAGMDFHAMVGMRTILRDACAFFMRRSFSTDEMYSAIFSQYVQTLVTDGDSGIEFFIEGTRSRTSKSLAPKYGFLTMALKPFFIGQVPDITIIPVNLSYDRVLEETLFAYELLGVPKPKESTKGFFKSLSILKQNYGNIYVQFGDAFSVKSYFGNQIDRSIHGYGSVQTQDLTLEESKHIMTLAHTIIRKQKALTILSCFNLIAAIINNNFYNERNPLTVEELVVEVKWFLDVLKVVAPPSSIWTLNCIEADVIISHLKLHESLIFVSEKGKVQLCRIHIVDSSALDFKKLKGHNLSNSTMDISIPLLMLQYYVNPCSTFLVSICFIALIVGKLIEECSIDYIYNEFKFFCSVFSYEFVFYPDFFQKDFEEALKSSSHLNLIQNINDKIQKGNDTKLLSFCVNFLNSYIPGYITVAEYFLKANETEIKEKEILKECQEMVEKKLNNGLFMHPSNLSLDMLTNAYQSFVSMKVVTKIKEQSETIYNVNKEKMSDIYNKLKSYDISEKFDGNKSEHFSVFIKNNL